MKGYVETAFSGMKPNLPQRFLIWLDYFLPTYLFKFQAGELYEKIGKYQEALQCYRRGDSYARGNSRPTENDFFFNEND